MFQRIAGHCGEPTKQQQLRQPLESPNLLPHQDGRHQRPSESWHRQQQTFSQQTLRPPGAKKVPGVTCQQLVMRRSPGHQVTTALQSQLNKQRVHAY